MKKITFTANRAEKLLKSLEKNVESASYSAFSAALRKKDVAVNGIKQHENSDVVPGDEITIFCRTAHSARILQYFTRMKMFFS